MPRATTPRKPRIATGRLLLRPPARADVDRIVAELDDFAVTRWLSRVPHPYTHEDGQTFVDAVAVANGRDLALAITRDGAVIGGIGLTGILTEREFGYWLGRAHWGKGYATEASAAFLAWCFDAYGLETIRSGVFTGNEASLRVQDKLGFVRIGKRMVHCLSQGKDMEHIDTLLTREGFALAAAPLA